MIDRMIREVLAWVHGQITVEERLENNYADYILRSGDSIVVVEAKKIGASFPSPTKRRFLKLSGSVLGGGEIRDAIIQVNRYALEKQATFAVATNGLCWCVFQSFESIELPDTNAFLYFPLAHPQDAEELFRILSPRGVETFALQEQFEKSEIQPEKRLLNIVGESEARIDRNIVADYIGPALNNAFYQETIASDASLLERCFVSTTSRSKYDRVLGMHLVDVKPVSIRARRIRTDRESGELRTIVQTSIPTPVPPVTLVVGGVGVGKSTYLKHFELVSGKIALSKGQNWVYIDFESMGRGGNTRKFLYEKLKEFLLVRTDYSSAVEPAYKSEVEGLKRGPLALLKDETRVAEIITAHISADFERVEPYVDKIFRYLAQQQTTILVLDNIDLYEDENLEKDVLSEGVGLAKRLSCHVIVVLRDSTYVKHKNDAAFNAFEMRLLWLDPPPFRAVLSKRLSLSQSILNNVDADIPLPNGMHLRVPNLATFFEAVQKSILHGEPGYFVEAMAGLNVRRGLSLVVNFLVSGHINAERAVKSVLVGQSYEFPFHEIFKGAILGHWKYYREVRSGCLNLLDARLGSRSLKLLRLVIVSLLFKEAVYESTAKVRVNQLIVKLSRLGASETQILEVLKVLRAAEILRSSDNVDITPDSEIFLVRTGGYLYKYLLDKMSYLEACLHDTTIEDEDIWERLVTITHQIEGEANILIRMRLRRERARVFLEYISAQERDALVILEEGLAPRLSGALRLALAEFDRALAAIQRQGLQRAVSPLSNP